jgi:hypothetical protein
MTEIRSKWMTLVCTRLTQACWGWNR